jgi:NAD(P)-dependent dehydrogenase (short-subunit alcohol dehydrogenase family)
MTDKKQNKIAIVTGGSKGIGEAVCRLFSKNNILPIVADIDEERGMKIASETNGFFIKTDISKEEEVKHLFELSKKKYGCLDIVVNTAKVFIYKSAEETTNNEWDVLVDVNLKGLFFLSKLSLPLLKETKGVLIDVSSGLGAKLENEAAVYCLTKSAASAFVKSLAKSAAPDVRVLSVSPGPINTPLLNTAFSGNIERYGKLNPLKRVGAPEEVAELIFYLASAEYVTGTVHSIDGGESC